MYGPQTTFGIEISGTSPPKVAEGEAEKGGRAQILDRLTNLRANKSFIIQKNKQDLAMQLQTPLSPPVTINNLDGPQVVSRVG